MYEIIKNVILNGHKPLKDLLKSISANEVEGNITLEQKEELSALARENADVKNETDLFEKVLELEERVKKLEDQKQTVNPEKPEKNVEEYKAGKWYYEGDLVLENGKTYQCVLKNMPCVWSPSAYPRGWKVIE